MILFLKFSMLPSERENEWTIPFDVLFITSFLFPLGLTSFSPGGFFTLMKFLAETIVPDLFDDFDQIFSLGLS